MTREEKINILKSRKEEAEIDGYFGFATALESAIKALEQEPTTKNDLVDCISRDDVRDVMQELWGTSGELMDRLMALPSVTPQEPKIVTIAEIKFDEDKLKELVNKAVLTVIPQESKIGYWEHGRELSRVFMGDTLKGINYEDWHCSNCHCVVEQSIKPKWNYCPFCGADMREVEE